MPVDRDVILDALEVAWLPGLEVRVSDLLAAGPDEVPLDGLVVQTKPLDVAVVGAREEGVDDEILFGLAGDAGQVAAESDGLCLGAKPRLGGAGEAVIATVTARTRIPLEEREVGCLN